MKYLGTLLVILGLIGSLYSVDYTLLAQYYEGIDKSTYYPSVVICVVGTVLIIFGGKSEWDK